LLAELAAAASAAAAEAPNLLSSLRLIAAGNSPEAGVIAPDIGDLGDMGAMGDMGEMMDTETGLLDSTLDGMNMDMGVAMDDLDENGGGFMDMLNTGELDLGDDILSGNMGGDMGEPES